ncbi:hypothetical protein L9F63_024236, partial [Diploptera punctata]
MDKEEKVVTVNGIGGDETSEAMHEEAVNELVEKMSRLDITDDEEMRGIGEDTGNLSPRRSPKKEEPTCVYHLKRVLWHGKKIPIVTQNENGPCPLIAISNVLLLRGKIFLPQLIEMITAEQLVEYIGDAIISSVPKKLLVVSCISRLLNYEQNVQDAIAVLPKLHTGLDVNVQFTGVTSFEYTSECNVFDLLNITLYHGWVIDPQCPEVVSAIGSLGYNQIVEKIINNKGSNEDELVTEALIAEQFLEKTASQMTYHGLCELHAAMKNEELAVLFRNNHFSTILKHRDELFQLVTDQGFLHETKVVWETLSNIEGDGMFVDGHFITVPPKESTFPMDSDNNEKCCS